MPTTTTERPTVAALAVEVAALRDENTNLAVRLSTVRRDLDEVREALADLRRQVATEVRTRRLVVVDDDGVERITTAVFPHSTTLHVEWGDDRTLEHASTSLWVGTGAHEGEAAEAAINASTGDNKYALLQQRSYVDGRTESEVQLVADDQSSTLSVGS